MEELQLKFELFEGPLDLLLSLIEKHKLNIFDIPAVSDAEKLHISCELPLADIHCLWYDRELLHGGPAPIMDRGTDTAMAQGIMPTMTTPELARSMARAVGESPCF